MGGVSCGFAEVSRFGGQHVCLYPNGASVVVVSVVSFQCVVLVMVIEAGCGFVGDLGGFVALKASGRALFE